MGRKPTKPGAIPRFRPRRQKSGRVCYYYDHGIGADGKRHEEPLGADYGLAIKRWAELERERNPPAAAVLTFRHVANAYRTSGLKVRAIGLANQCVRLFRAPQTGGGRVMFRPGKTACSRRLRGATCPARAAIEAGLAPID